MIYTASLLELLYDIRRIEEHREQLTEKRIKKMYETLINDLQVFLSETYIKYSDEDGRLYISYLDSQRKRAWFLNEISENVNNLEPTLKKEMLSLIDETYSACYKGMIKSLKNAEKTGDFENISKDIPVNPNVLKQAINNNISKLTLPAVMEKHRNEIVYQIQQELGIGLMQGDRYEKMAKRISERVDVSYSKAMNIVRTESHRNVENGFMDCAEHIQEGLEGSDLIYAATWRTMGDQRVRPQQRRKTKKGWKTSYSKNGANHIKLEGQTVKVGELFDLGNGVKAKAPGKSGVAAHDCNCRCFIEYNLMTPEEFEKATGKKVKKTKQVEKVELKLSDYPEKFTKGAEGKNTQKLIDYINNIEGADPNTLKLYASIGKLENLSENDIAFKISHAQSYSVQAKSMVISGDLIEVKLTIPKLKGDNLAGQVNTTLHEQMHLIDLFGREDVTKNGKWFSVRNKPLVDTFKNTTDSISDEISEIFKKHNSECKEIIKAGQKRYDEKRREIKEKYLPNGMSLWDNLSGYEQYEKEAKKIYKEMIANVEYQCRNIMGGGIDKLQDIYDALSSGSYRTNEVVIYGHGRQYYSNVENQIVETIANYASLSVTRPDLIELLRKDKPELCKALDEVIIELLKKVGE